jgi:hypothetical protein
MGIAHDQGMTPIDFWVNGQGYIDFVCKKTVSDQ